MRMITNQSQISWRLYSWPTWIPASVRAQIEDVWRSPLDWHRNSDNVHAPRLGSTHHITAGSQAVVGQYVHVPGLIGRLVNRSTCPPRVHVVVLDNGHPKALPSRAALPAQSGRKP
jgi:hypothetical protein